MTSNNLVTENKVDLIAFAAFTIQSIACMGSVNDKHADFYTNLSESHFE